MISNRHTTPHANTYIVLLLLLLLLLLNCASFAAIAPAAPAAGAAAATAASAAAASAAAASASFFRSAYSRSRLVQYEGVGLGLGFGRVQRLGSVVGVSGQGKDWE